MTRRAPRRPVPTETAPQLRFGVAALPETSRELGDGAAMSAWFVDEAGEVELGRAVVDAKNERDDRAWREVRLDLSAVAGRTGALAFRVADVDDEPDPLDALLLGTPRIEPAGEAPAAPKPPPNIMSIAATASASFSAMTTPLPAARPSAFTTCG